MNDPFISLRNCALDKMQEGVLISSRQREVRYVNDAFVHLSGYSREELLGKQPNPWLQRLADHAETSKPLREAWDHGQVFHAELLNYRPDGSSFWADLSLTPMVDPQGTLIEYLVVFRDIHAQKEAALALEKSEEQLKLVIKGSNDSLWDWRIAEDTIERDPSWYNMLGYEVLSGASPSATLMQLIHPDDLQRVNTETQALLASTTDHLTLELRVLHKDGHYLSLLTRGHILRDETGKAVRVCGIATNLTQQKEREAKLSLAAAMFMKNREGILITDAECHIIMVNKAFTDITGYAEADVLDKNPRMLASGRQAPAFYEAMWNTLQTEDQWEGEVWNRRRDDTIYPEWLAISAIRDARQQITHYIGSFSDLSDGKAAESRIQQLSHFDTLTGLPNRFLLKTRTEQTMTMVRRNNEPLTMMLMGIDHFKSINDALGHPAGDQLLIGIAKRLGSAVREQDILAHLGGKEFVLVLPDTAADGAAHLARDLLEKLAAPFQIGDHDLTLTASIGIASYPIDAQDFDALFKSVEIAMHRAQASGRDTFQFYSEDLYQQVRARDNMVKALRNAAALDQLELVYQPLMDLQNGQISGMEALLRWTHPQWGMIPPTQFIPLAEGADLIKGIGEWVLRRTCRDLRTWLDKGLRIPHVAVNISPLQFEDNDLIAQIKRATAEHQIDPGLLYLEMTESALMGNNQRSEDMLKQIKKMGIKLSLDDFGTGYSSLSYLKRFPFDKIKIDQSFVRDITVNQSDHVIVNVIVSMAHGLGLKAIAEGVETEAQCEIMRASGCDEIQGYFFSKPISARDIEELFSQGRQLPPHLLRLQKPQRTLLLVDDEPNIVAALKRLFRRDGLLILTANSGAQGLEILSKHKVDVIISDQRMPGMTGVEFLRAAKTTHPDTMRIVLSGYTELQSVTDAINEGAVYRFLTKPWEDAQLHEQIQNAFSHKELQEENRQLDLKIRSMNQELVAANRSLAEVLCETRHQVERETASLEIVREALQNIPLPVIGVDDEGLMAFINTAAQHLFEGAGPLLGIELLHALPAVNSAISSAAEGMACDLLIDQTHYAVRWNTMGANSPSRGKLLTLSKKGPPI